MPRARRRPGGLPRTYADAINAALRDTPAGMTVTIHTCRGNFKSTWVASGGYEPVAEAMFSADVDGYFMEFDSERAGGFEPLRFVPREARRSCWAWSPPRCGELESKDDTEAPHRRGGEVSCRWRICACRRSAAFPARTTATRCRRTISGASSSVIVEVAREVWR